MTKLEEKLIELGYEKSSIWYIYEKFYTSLLLIKIDTRDLDNSRVFPYGFWGVYTQQDINNLQQAYNEMQKDLAILKEYENE